MKSQEFAKLISHVTSAAALMKEFNKEFRRREKAVSKASNIRDKVMGENISKHHPKLIKANSSLKEAEVSLAEIEKFYNQIYRILLRQFS